LFVVQYVCQEQTKLIGHQQRQTREGVREYTHSIRPWHTYIASCMCHCVIEHTHTCMHDDASGGFWHTTIIEGMVRRSLSIRALEPKVTI